MNKCAFVLQSIKSIFKSQHFGFSGQKAGVSFGRPRKIGNESEGFQDGGYKILQILHNIVKIIDV